MQINFLRFFDLLLGCPFFNISSDISWRIGPRSGYPEAAWHYLS